MLISVLIRYSCNNLNPKNSPTRPKNRNSVGMGGREGEREWTATIQLAHGGGGGGTADANGGV